MTGESRHGAPEKIEAVFRNGSVTVVGVLAGFSLTFLTTWATTPTPWSLNDLLGLTPLLGGVILQIWSLAALLEPNSLEVPRYSRAIHRFMLGLALVGLGIVIVIGVDVLGSAHLNVI